MANVRGLILALVLTLLGTLFSAIPAPVAASTVADVSCGSATLDACRVQCLTAHNAAWNNGGSSAAGATQEACTYWYFVPVVGGLPAFRSKICSTSGGSTSCAERYFRSTQEPCPHAPTTYSDSLHRCPTANPTQTAACDAKPEIYSAFQYQNGGITCSGGCLYSAANLGDGGEVLMTRVTNATATGLGFPSNVCETATSISCPSGFVSGFWGSITNQCIASSDDSDGDGILNGVDPTPNVPGSDTTDSDGDGVPDVLDAFPMDGTNGKNLEGGQTRNTSTGGGSCLSPPVSNGDAIAGQVAYQAWSTRCAVERHAAQAHTDALAVAAAASSGGGSSGGGLSTADSDKLSAIEANTDNLNGTVSFSDVTAAIPGEGVTAADAFGTPSVETGIADGFDDSGWLTGTRQCPDLPTLTMPEFIGGAVIDLNNPFAGFCTLMSYAGMFVWLFAALASIKIYSKVI